MISRVAVTIVLFLLLQAACFRSLIFKGKGVLSSHYGFGWPFQFLNVRIFARTGTWGCDFFALLFAVDFLSSVLLLYLLWLGIKRVSSRKLQFSLCQMFVTVFTVGVTIFFFGYLESIQDTFPFSESTMATIIRRLANVTLTFLTIDSILQFGRFQFLESNVARNSTNKSSLSRSIRK